MFSSSVSLETTVIPSSGQMGNKGYAEFCVINKVYYGGCGNGE